MDQAIATVVAAVLALTGVLIGLIVGIKRWRAERQDAKGAQFGRERQDAYRGVWSSVEALHVAMRTEGLAVDALEARVRDINAALLTSGLYIDESDRVLATQYVEAIRNLQSAVSVSDDSEAKRHFAATDWIPPETIKNAGAIVDAQRRAQDIRNTLIQRFRHVLAPAKE